MRIVVAAMTLVGLVAGASAISMRASGGPFDWKERPSRFDRRPGPGFARVGTFANYRNNANRKDVTVSEIVAATSDGMTLVYTDSALGLIGFIDITNPANPLPDGTVDIDSDPTDEVDYGPTSVDVLENRYALVGADTSESFTNRSGSLVVVDVATRLIVADIPLGGQPDSVTISPDRKYAAISMENERNEDLCVGGALDGQEADEDDCEAGGGELGVLPQTPYGNPAGFLAVVRLSGHPSTWVAQSVDLTGYAGYAPEDPEPEFVDINSRNEAVVTLQENNHLIIVDLKTRTVLRDFAAGSVDLNGVDATEDGVIMPTESLDDVPREPDAVTWVPGPGGAMNIATANEGDLFGGSRGFTVFRRHGQVLFDSGEALEHLAIQHGHYPEGRSGSKGTEPEAIEYGEFDGRDYVFVGSERGSFVAVYTLGSSGRPRFEQLLPAPLGPEGLLAIPSRNLLIASGEEDTPEFGVRSTVMIYQLKRSGGTYPQILSDDDHGVPIGWSAMSGLTSIPGDPGALLGIWDSAYSATSIFRIDVTDEPAVITDALTLVGGARNGTYDPEGLAIAPDGTMWIASEGNATDSVQNLLIHAGADGNVIDEIGLPAEILNCRKATTLRGTLGSGFEGVAVLRSPGDGGAYRLIVAQQRGWDYTTPACEALDDDDGGLNALKQPNRTRLWIYDPSAGTWSHIAWELAPKPANAAWVGLSEVTELVGGDFIVLERDNLTGDFGELKTLVAIDRSARVDGLISQSEKLVFNMRPRLTATRGWMTDKPEGVAVTRDGRTFVVTDNDGVDGWSGETWFLPLGRYWNLF